MFASPAIILRDFLCCSSEASIPVMNVQIFPSCLSAFTWVLNSTITNSFTIWRLFSSTKADMLRGYIIALTPCSPCNSLPLYVRCLKKIRWSSMPFSSHKLQPPWVMADKKIKIWIQNHIICRTKTDWRSYLITGFKPAHLPNTVMENFIDG